MKLFPNTFISRRGIPYMFMAAALVLLFLPTGAFADTTPPSGTLSINYGSNFTNSISVSLFLTCDDQGGTGCSEMQFSNDNITYSAAEPFAQSKDWTLDAGEGTKTVYIKLKDVAGNWSGAFADSVIYNSTVPETFITPPLVAAGGYHTASLKTDGTLWAWGSNYYGQLGKGDTAESHDPVQIGSDTSWRFLVAGELDTMAIKTDGTLWAWGENAYGHLGLGDTTTRLSPVQVGTDADWKNVSAGSRHTVAVKTDGTLWAWGYNALGQLGIANTIDKSSPVKVGLDTDWISAEAGEFHTVSVKTDGTLWAWGRNHYGQLGIGNTADNDSPVQVGTDTNWVLVSASTNYTIGLKTDGTLWAWGDNYYGQLGIGSTIDQLSPVQVGTDSDWASLSLGWGDHVLALKTDGTLWAWGSNYYGQLGIGSTIDQLLPVQVGTDADWAAASAGGGHSTAVKSDGTLHEWGWNYYGQLGTGDLIDLNAPALIEMLTIQLYSITVSMDGTGTGTVSDTVSHTVIDCGSDCSEILPAGDTVTLAATPDAGSEFAGWSGGGCSGLGLCQVDMWANNVITATFNTDVSPPTGSVSINYGFGYTDSASVRLSLSCNDGGGIGCAGMMLSNDDITYTSEEPFRPHRDWELDAGDGTKTVYVKFKDNAGLWSSAFSDTIELDSTAPGFVIPQVAAAENRSLSIKSDGTLWAWGFGQQGQLGVGDVQARFAPTQVGTDADWEHLTAGRYHTVSTKSDGTLWAWGLNTSGQLGIGNMTGPETCTSQACSTSPIQVGTDTDWGPVSGGEYTTLARKSNGSIWGWVSDPQTIGLEFDWASVSAGARHNLAIKTNGTLYAWGQNYYGQLGLGDNTDRPLPYQVGLENDWVEVDGGYHHSMAVKSDGTLWAWGWNPYGQLGIMNITDQNSPVRVGTEMDWAYVSAGRHYTMAIKTDGTLWAWGYNNYGQLGLGDSTSRTSPVQVGTDTDWVIVDAGDYHTLAIKSNGTLWAWGRGGYGQLGLGGASSSTVPGMVGSIFLSQRTLTAGRSGSGTGTVTGTGIDCGADCLQVFNDGDTVTLTAAPDASSTFTGWSGDCSGTGICSLTMDADRSVTADFTLDTDAPSGSVAVEFGTTIVNSTSVTLVLECNDGSGTGCATMELSSDGVTYDPVETFNVTKAWTLSAGDGTKTVYVKYTDGAGNTSIAYSDTIELDSTAFGGYKMSPKVVAAGYDGFSLAIMSDGSLWAWGYNNHGQLGLGDATIRYSPERVGSDKDWNDIDGGGGNTLAIKNDGTLWACGYNAQGQLGIGNTTEPYSLVKVGTDTDWASVDAGAYHTLALKSDGTLWAWGYNNYGQLGIGNTTDQYTPVQMGTDADWVSSAVGEYHTLALKSDGTLWSWGWNAYGQLGQGPADASLPEQVGTDTDWVAVAAGNHESAAIKSDGTLWVWGWNRYGELGLGDTMQRGYPVRMGTDTDWAAVDIDNFTFVTKKSDGSIWAWGVNQYGQLGIGNTTNIFSPVQVGTDKDWDAVSLGGGSHVLALKTDNTLWAWGRNSYGQLGTGDQTNRLSPVQVWSTLAQQYTLSVSKSGDGTGTVGGPGIDCGADCTQVFNDSDDFTLTAVPDAGYYFTGWSGACTGTRDCNARINGDTGVTATFISDSSPPTGSLSINSGMSFTNTTSVNLYINCNDGAGIGCSGMRFSNDGITYTAEEPFALTRNWTLTAGGGLKTVYVELSDFAGNWSGPFTNTITLYTDAPSYTRPQAAAGESHSLMVKADGSLWATGENSSYQLGLGDTNDRLYPTRVGTDTDWKRIAAGAYHSVAIKADGTLWAWGNNANGQLGIGNTVAHSTPVRVGTDTDWAYVDAGYVYTLAVKVDGTLWAWGNNGYGQLGTGDQTERLSPVKVGLDADWASVSVGRYHNLAIKTDGTLWAWGYNLDGQLGLGDYASRLSPVQVGTDTDWKRIAAGANSSTAIKADGTLWIWWVKDPSPVQKNADTDWASIFSGDYHVHAIKTDGTLWAWGSNNWGQLGLGDLNVRNDPEQVGAEADWVYGNSGYRHTLAIRADGTLWAWGERSSGRLGDGYGSGRLDTPFSPANVIEQLLTLTVDTAGTGTGTVTGPEISCGTAGSDCLQMFYKDTSVPLMAEPDAGSYFETWSGACTDRSRCSITMISNTTVTGTFTADAVPPTGSIKINLDSELVSSEHVTLSLTCADNSGTGCAGMAFSNDDITYSAEELFGISKDWTIEPGTGLRTVYVKFRDRASNWSAPVSGTITVDPGIPAYASPVVVAGTYHTCVIKTDGALWVWGYNSNGRLGIGNTVDQHSPVQLGADNEWAHLAAGYDHMHAMKADGTLWAWGTNGGGRLGLGDTTERQSPVQVGTDADWAQVVAGNNHALAIKADSTLWAWGSNQFGQLGIGNTADYYSPVQVGTDADWASVVTGNSHVLAIKSDGTLWAWGYNSYGNLGLGDNSHKYSPVQVGTDTDWASVSAGGGHALAIKADGTLWAWGYNSYGQLGLGDNSNRNLPEQVGEDTDWAHLAAGESHTLAIKADGTLWAWGWNQYGQLGLGNTSNRLFPVQVGTDTDWIAVAASRHTLAIKADGTLWAWGYNGYGEIGTGDTNNRLSPVQVAALLVKPYPLTVTKTGTGTGTVTGSGIDCGTDCSEIVGYGTDVVLTATPSSGSYFSGWSGACTGTGDCTVTVTGYTDVTASFTLDVNAPTGGVAIDSGAVGTTSTAVTLSLTCGDGGETGCNTMALSDDDVTYLDEEPFTATRAWTVSAGDGTKQVYVKYRDHAGNQSGAFTDTIKLDTTPPAGTVSINSGASSVNTVSVTLSLSCNDGGGTGCEAMKLSHDGVTYSDEEPFSTTKAWTLTTGEGTKAVIVRFRDAMGNWSGTTTDTILYETVPPVTSASPTGGISGMAQDVTLTCDDGTGSGCNKTYYTTDGTTPDTSSGVYSVPISLVSDTTLKFRSVDYAGNMEAVRTESYTIDTTAPTGGLTIDYNALMTNSTSVALSMSCSDAGGSGCTEMKFSNDDVTYTTEEAFGVSRPWDLPAGDGTKTVYVKYRDNAGNWSSAVSDTIDLDTTPPTGSVSIESGASATNSTAVTLVLTCDDGGGAGCYQARFSNDGVSYSTAEAFSGTRQWNLPAGEGDKTVYVKYRDTLGNWSGAFTDTILYETAVPVSSASPAGGIYNTPQSVTLACDDGTGSGCDSIYYTTDGTAPDTSSDVFTSPLDLTADTTLRFRSVDYAGNMETVRTETYTVDITPPTGTVSINSGGSATNSTTVSLSLTCDDAGGTGCAEMRLSNDGVTYSAAEPYAPTRTWTIDAIEGERTVYVMFGDATGRWSGGISDGIIYDVTAPGLSIVTPQDGSTIDQLFEVSGSSSDTGSGVDRVELQMTDGTYYVDSDSKFASSPTWILANGTDSWLFNTSLVNWTSNRNYTLTARVTDMAGNITEQSAAYTYYTGEPALTMLSIELSSQTILQNDTIDLSGRLVRLPDSGVNLKDNGIQILVTAPDSSVDVHSATTYDTYGHFIYNGISGFTQKGAYSVQAIFDGNNFLTSSASDPKTILVGASAGYAIIVQGKIPNEEGLESHNKTANRIYNKLLNRNFVDDNIYYFNYDTTQTGVDAAPSKAGVQSAIETWAAGRMNGAAAPLYVIMVDHGNPDAFYLGSETITPADLDAWLGTLESALNATALEEKRVVIIGACYSGSFIDTVSGAGRVVVASAAADEESYKGPMEPDNIRSGEFFLEEFFVQLERGYSLREAFVEATEKTEIYTREGGGSANSNSYYLDSSVQHPHLEDNGDGVGSNVLSTDQGDGALSEGIYLGTGVSYNTNSASNPVEITSVSETIYLDAATVSAQLWAQANDDSQVDSMWMEIRSPSTVLSSSGGTGQLEVNLVKELMVLNVTSGRWEKTSNQFTESGMYEIFYFVRDIDTNEIAPLRRSVVYKAQAGNSAPQQFLLTSPANGSNEKTVLLLDWENASDPDGDPVTYTVLISRDNTFSTVDYKVEELTKSNLAVGTGAGLEDLTTYYWKVLAVDSYGAVTESIQTRQFITNNTNALPGIIEGYVYDANTSAAVSGATVSTSQGTSVITQPDGYYVLMVQAGAVTLSVASPGYVDMQRASTVDQGSARSVHFALVPVTFSVSVTSNTGGSVSPSGTVSVNQGDTLSLTISPDTGYHISDVLVDGVSKGAVSGYTLTNISANHSVSATFAINTYTIISLAGSGGSISPSGSTTLNFGDSLVVVIVPAPGYVIEDVVVDDTSMGALNSYTFAGVGADHTIMAVFRTGTYSLSCEYDDLECLEREDAESEFDNMVTGNPNAAVVFRFGVSATDSKGTPQHVRLMMSQRGSPLASDFTSYDMTCTGDYSSGAPCTYSTKLGPAAVHTYYFEMKTSDGLTVRYPSSGYLTGPDVQMLNGYNLVGAPRDINSAGLDGQTAFGSSRTYRWVSDSAYTNSGYYVTVTGADPAQAGEGYFTLSETTTLPELGAYGEVSGPHTYQLQPGWSLISNPYGGNVKLSDVMVRKGADAPVSWTQAVTNGWLTNAVYYYNGSDWGGTYSFESSGGSPDATLVPWVGYWMELKVSDDTYYLVIPKP